ncbi:MAG: signal recognition particle subunit SRP19/SEC65 family protein [Halobacteria archaeon]
MKGSRDRVILYPVYFDSSKTRAEGRRVSKTLAVERPTPDRLAAAAKALGLAAEAEAGAAHSRAPWAGGGRVEVQKRGTKEALMRDIARRLKGA